MRPFRQPHVRQGLGLRHRRGPARRRMGFERLEPRQLLSLAASPVGSSAGDSSWQQDPTADLAALSAEIVPGGPRNVILMIGDGMGPGHVEAARLFLAGEIVFDRAPYQAEIATYAANSSITDSAASATAMATGKKVNNGVISMAIPGDAAELTTSLEIYRDMGKATGLVTTATITHATPAVFGAHAPSRGDVDDIASDLLGQSKPNVLLGGGGQGMTVEDAAAAGYTVVTDRDGLLALDTDAEAFISGQFGTTYLPYEFDGLDDLPHLSEMTATALDVLENDPDGFFLMVEGGRIDHAGHANDIERNVRETVEFAGTVQSVLDWAAARTDTLILVTADHETGGLTVVTDNGPGNAPDVTWTTTGHTGVNVPVYAWGPGAEAIGGVIDNTDVFALTADVTPLGPISYQQLGHLDLSAEDLWFRGSTQREGLLSLEATADGPDGQLAVTLYDQDFNELATSAPVGDSQRIDWASDPDVAYYFRLSGGNADVQLNVANLVDRGDDSMTVFGTDGDDTFGFETLADGPVGAQIHRVTINGLSYEFSTPGVPSPPLFSVTYDGGSGNDNAVLSGSEGDEVATLRPNSGTLTGWGYELDYSGVSHVVFDGGDGADMARLYDSSGNDTLVGAKRFGRLTGDGFFNQATSVENVEAYGSQGHDTAKLFDSRGDDSYTAAPGYARLTGDGFEVRVESFHSVHTYATAGGRDVAKLYDSRGDDNLYASPTEASFLGDGFFNRAKSFEAVHAYATAGGFDTAELFDSAGDDGLYASPTEAAMYGSGFYNRAKFFESVKGSATEGGHDEAELFDSAGADDFLAMPTYARLRGQGFANEAVHFDSVYARATAGGRDVAKFFDSSGDDRFLAMPGYAHLKGDGYENRAKGFAAAHAYATAGGRDQAKLYDSPGDDGFYADPVEGALYGDGFYNRAKHFEAVHAYATAGGRDVANLFDSAGDDTFYSQDIDGALYGQGFYNRAKQFEEVYAHADSGGYDEAYLNDSPQSDLLEAQGDWARLSNAALDFLYEAGSFDYVEATATSSADTKVTAPLAELDFVLQIEGPWQDP